MKKRILLARLFHETNTFVETPTVAADFDRVCGEALFERRGDGSPLGAFLDFVEDADVADWEVVPLVDWACSPSGTVEDAAFEQYWNELRAAVDAVEGACDGFFFVLHGAMACRGIGDAEGEILERIRAVPSLAEIPLFAVLDLHANVTPRMARHSDALFVYRENPHIDAAETALRAARALAECLTRGGHRPLNTLRQVDVLWPATGTGTADAPMRGLEALAREQEAEAGVLAVNVCPGFAHADIAEAGVSFSVAHEPDFKPDAVLDRLVAFAHEHRREGLPEEWELEAAIDDALAKGNFPVCVVETADNIGGGAPGDGTAVLRAFVERDITGSFVVINDPAAAALAAEAGVGKSVALLLGGRGFSGDPGPLALEVEVLRVSDGRFDLEDRQSHLASMCGVHIDMGRTAVVRHGGVTVLITSHKTPPFDLGMARSQGIEPAECTLVGVKAAVAYRRAWERVASSHYFVRTPGPCASDLRSLEYRRVRRPIFPLDD